MSMDVLKTPDDRFCNLADFPDRPGTQILDADGTALRISLRR
jgi:hypothetical protein